MKNKFTCTLKVPIELYINHKPVYCNEVEIGSIVDTRVVGRDLVATVQINKKYKSIFKKLELVLKEL
jgi:paraquat-inducible protein B